MNRNNEMYELYDEYKNTMAISKKARNKRQKINRKIREIYDQPFKRRDHVVNTNDITNWNSMIRDLEHDMKMMEMYLDFEDRHYLHKEYFDTKSMIYNQNSYEGTIPIEEIFGETTPDTTEIVTRVELQNEIVELLNDVLTERQRKIIYMYFWNRMTQEEIGELLGVTRQAISETLSKSLDTLRDACSVDFLDYL